MKKLWLLSGMLVGGAVASRLGSEERRRAARRLGEKMRERMKSHMERMMEEMPEDSPPRLVMSTLPRLAEQNERILALLREQNALLRESRPEREAGVGT